MSIKQTLTQRQKAIRHEAILQAAEALFTEQGFAAVRFEDVAAAACISKPTLYSHFRSKEALAIGLALRQLGLVLSYLKSQDQRKEASARLDEFIEWACSFRFGGNSRFVYSLAQFVLPLKQTESALITAEDELLERLASLISQGQKEGRVRPDMDPRCLAAVMLGSQHGYLDRLLHDGSTSLADIIAMWRALLKGAGPA